MKKVVVLVLIGILLLSFFACGSGTNKGDSITFDTRIFSGFLDAEHFVPGMTQDEFFTQMEKYSYNQEKITDIVQGMYYDGNNGGGYSAFADLFGIYCDYNQGVHTNGLSTEVQLDGLTLPQGISFDDTLVTVLQKLGIDMDPYDEFVSDEDGTGIMTIYSDDTASLVLMNQALLPEKEQHAWTDNMEYILTYTENYPTTQTDGEPVMGTRCVTIYFDDGKLFLFKMSVSE